MSISQLYVTLLIELSFALFMPLLPYSISRRLVYFIL